MKRRDVLTAAAAAATLRPAIAAAIPELCAMTAVQQAALLRARKLSARELLAAHLKWIEQINPKVNAIISLVPEMAQKRAAALDEAAAKGRFAGPLHGLPAAHKDLVETKGIRTTYGSPIFKDNVPTFNALVVERMQQAGVVTIGKTNTPEFGAGSQTFNPVFGSTKNPYDLTKTCGGSSGGAAVALATRMLPIADGSDMGGSLRNPAAFCGVVGFRTTPGRVPVEGSWNNLSVVGPMGRTVEDTALLLSVQAGPDPRAPLALPDPGARFARIPPRDFKGVRIAWCPRFSSLPFDRRILEVMESRRQVFTKLGAIVEDVEVDFSEADECFKTLRSVAFYQNHGAKLAQYRSQLKDTIIEELERGARLTGPEVAEAWTKRTRVYAKFAALMSKYHYLLLPVTQVPAFDVTQPYVTEIEGAKMATYVDWMRSCYFITVTSHPALAIPMGQTREGLPVGLQIVGRQHAEIEVLQLALAFEKSFGVLPAPTL